MERLLEKVRHPVELIFPFIHYSQLLPGVDINQDSDSDPEIDIGKLVPKNDTLTRNDEDEGATSTMVQHMRDLEIDPQRHRFVGKSR